MDNLGFSNDSDENKKKNSNHNKENQKIYPFNEAVALTGYGKFNYILLFVCGLCMMSVMTEGMGIGFIMPLVKCDLKFTLNEQGILASAGYFGNVISSHLTGFLSDTAGRLKILRISVVITSLCSIISAFSVNVWMLIVLRFLVGFFVVACQACNYTYLGEFYANERRTRNVTMLSTFIPLALIYMPGMLTIFLPLKFDWYIFGMHFAMWRFFILCNALPGLLALFALPFFPESPRYVLVQGRENEAIDILKSVFTRNTGLPPEDYPVKNITTDIKGSSLNNVKTLSDGFKLIWNQTILLFTKERLWNTLNLIVHVFVIFGIAQGTFMWIPSILNKLVENYDTNKIVCQAFHSETPTSVNVTNITDDECSVDVDVFMYQILVCIGIAYTIVYVTFSNVINFIGKKRLLIIWLLVNGLCSIALNWSTGFYLNIVLITLMLSISNCAGIVNTISMEYFPTNINAMAMCLLVSIGRLGSSFASNVIGQVLAYDCNYLFNGCGVLILLLLGLSYVLPTKSS